MITLLLGGARSGKSDFGERLAAASAARRGCGVTYVATMRLDIGGHDDVLAARIAAHRARRPAGWATIDAGEDLAAVVRGLAGTVLIDSLGPYVAAQPEFLADVEALADVLVGRDGDSIVVSDEVGLGVHPETEAGGRFRDALGAANRAVAAVADKSFLIVVGRALRLDDVPEL